VTVLSIPAILLRSYPYSETSQILRFYSESHGIVGAMARGVRKAGGKRGGSLATFSEGILDFHFRENRDLQTFREFSPTRARSGLARDPMRFTGASVLAELILKHAESEGNEVIFHRLGLGLDAAESEDRDRFLPTVLAHLWSLIEALGFGPLLGECVSCGQRFEIDEIVRFDFGAGGARCANCQDEAGGPRLGPVARSQLLDLLSGNAPEDLIRPLTHLRLVSDFITYHVSGGTPLKSMAVLASFCGEGNA
jgi:DNA repair protein RecO (recombination protein O)